MKYHAFVLDQPGKIGRRIGVNLLALAAATIGFAGAPAMAQSVSPAKIVINGPALGTGCRSNDVQYCLPPAPGDNTPFSLTMGSTAFPPGLSGTFGPGAVTILPGQCANFRWTFCGGPVSAGSFAVQFKGFNGAVLGTIP